ncbi:O-antigen polysaccharide polymerase Wzy [Acinetobacter indicus]|uniref:O-antigen polysaccharide polymerase Wzy n=1 Tax=Acinetobacter indicus TaxID=756892 RepID=UPI001443ECCF|nr:O-antigen polysaccharide polymerase Wzy [Acinetobacter indicus]
MIFNVRVILTSIYAPFLILLLVIYLNYSPYYNLYDLIIYFLITIFLTLVFFLKGEPKESLRGQWLKHSNIFLIGYFIVHFQFYLDLIFGFQSIENDLFVNNYLIIIKSMIISLIGLICFYMGYSISVLIKRNNHKNNMSQKISTIFLQTLSYIILFYYYAKVNPLYLNGGYNIYDQGGEAKYAAVAFTATMYALLIQKIRNLSLTTNIPKSLFEYFKMIGIGSVLPVILYLLGVLASGDRGPIIIFSLLYFSGYIILTKKKIKIIYILLLLIIAGLVISTLGEARKIGRENELGFWEKISAAYYSDEDAEKKSILPATRELSISVSALHHIVDYLPSRSDYLYGKIQLNEAKLSIPLGAVIFNYSESPENRKVVNIQNYVTWVAQGDNPSYGNGGTVIADLYSIFGIVSIIYGMFTLGWFVRVLEVRMFVNPTNNIFWQILPIIYFCEILYLSRSSILGSLKIIILVALLLYINRFIMYKQK